MSKQFSHDKLAIGSSDEYLTPPLIIQALGPFDIDPCAPVGRPWDTAKVHYTKKENGLAQPWGGRKWLNPPYSDAWPWMDRLNKEGNGIALLFGRTDTGLYFDNIWGQATAVLFLQGRLTFYTVEGKPVVSKKTGRPSPAGAPSILIAYGQENADALRYSGLRGGDMKSEISIPEKVREALRKLVKR